MRKIKFRAWDKNYKKMLMVDNLDFISGALVHVTAKGHHEQIAEDYKLMQFTGLLDKNGVEIYEGDILELKGYKNIVIGVFVVKWNDKGFWDYGIDETRSKIIGNIYENKDLIEKNEKNK